MKDIPAVRSTFVRQLLFIRSGCGIPGFQAAGRPAGKSVLHTAQTSAEAIVSSTCLKSG